MSSENHVYILLPYVISSEIKEQIQIIFDVPEREIPTVWRALHDIGKDLVSESADAKSYLAKALKNGWKLQSIYTQPNNYLVFSPFFQPQ